MKTMTKLFFLFAWVGPEDQLKFQKENFLLLDGEEQVMILSIEAIRLLREPIQDFCKNWNCLFLVEHNAKVVLDASSLESIQINTFALAESKVIKIDWKTGNS